MVYYILRCAITFVSSLALRRKVIGKKNMPQHSACIVVANHVNLVDSPLIGISLGRKVHFMAKEDLFHSRVIGWLADKFGAFPVARGKINRRAGRTAVELLSNGQVLIIYPEGQRSLDGKLGPAYSGAALLATRGCVPIVPVGIIGTGKLKGKWWFLRRPKITMNIGEPFSLPVFTDKPTKDEITGMTREIMLHIARLLPEDYRGSYTI
jgi:1-acyl-sn-glycerol-3-phosphate acyltransferase